MSSEYQVYVEASADPSEAGRAALAGRMAQRYGMPVDAIAQRLAVGRFRVKGGVDLQTAERFADDLRSLGARCSVVDDAGAIVGAPAPGPAMAATLQAPAAAPAPAPGAAEAPRKPGERQSLAALAASAPSQRPSQQLVSPLAGISKQPSEKKSAERTALEVADEWDEDSQDLGAIGTGEFALSTLDGTDGAEEVPLDESFDPAGEDAFAPPDSQTKDLELALEVAPPPPRGAPAPAEEEPLTLMPEQRGASAPPASRPSSESPAATASASYQSPAASLAATMQEAEQATTQPAVSLKTKLARRPRTRLVAGVFLAVVLGFIPAHVVGSMRQETSFEQVDATVRTTQAEVRTASEWEALDEFRAGQLALKRSKQKNLAITGFAIWGALGAALAFGWFRKVDWQRWA